MPTITPGRYRYLCPVCRRHVAWGSDAMECEDDDGWIVRYHSDCYDKALEDDE
jgi:hypothetical protein